MIANRTPDVEWGDKLIMYYATRDPSSKIQMLHAIAAPRKSQFNRGDWQSISDGPVLKPELRWETRCIKAPSVIKRGDTLYLFCGGGYNNAPQQIGCAVSKDGIGFQRLFIDTPLLANGVPGTWNSPESGHPGMFEDEDGQLYMFYQGNSDKGRTWFLSWVKTGWDGDKPRVIEPHKVNNPCNTHPSSPHRSSAG